jgi:hypothetical protein
LKFIFFFDIKKSFIFIEGYNSRSEEAEQKVRKLEDRTNEIVVYQEKKVE